MKFGSLFAGIGGLDLGLERAGMECSWQVEIDDFCQKVLTKHWPDVPKYGDIRNVGKENLETVDLICGGFPCQPFSVAGKRRGTKDDRHLWPEMLRVISELKPTWIVGENVSGIINIFLDQAISDLEAEGYSCEAYVLPACAFDAPHRRDRVFIVGNLNNIRHIRRKSKKYSAERGEYSQRELISSGSHEDVPNTSEVGRNSSGNSWRERQVQRNKKRNDTQNKQIGEGRQFVASKNGELENVADSEFERLQGQPIGQTQSIQPAERSKKPGIWSTESGLGGVADGLSRWLDEPNIPRVGVKIPDRTNRLKALGNAVVPQVAEHIGRIIVEEHNK